MTKKNIYIRIYGSSSVLEGDFPLGEIRTLTSYPVEGAKYSEAYKKGLWDGRKHLFHKKTHAFPTGLAHLIKTYLENTGAYSVQVEDKRPKFSPVTCSFDLEGIKMSGKYSYQLDACEKMIKNKQGIVKIGTGGGKTAIAAAVTKYLGLNTLFVVTTRELLYQAARSFEKFLDLKEGEVGLIGDGHWSPGKNITIATVGTLESRIKRKECAEFLKKVEVLFLDEAHHAGSETWYKVCMMCPAYYRYGLSGTPLDRTDGANLRLIAVTGPVIVNIPTKQLVDLGVCAKAQIVWDKITEPILPRRKQYASVYKEGVSENEVLLEKVIEWTTLLYEQGLGVLVLVEEIKHGKMIDEALWTETQGVFVPHQFIYGNEDTDTRKKALKDFESRQLPVLISSTILDEGVDVPTIDALIVAGSRKSKIKTMQRIGRGLRGEKLIVIEFANYCHKYLIDHSLSRLRDYKEEDCFDMYNSSPDKDLIKDLWNKY